MKHTKKSSEIIGSTGAFAEPELIVECKHCGKPIDHTRLLGLSLICPLCKKPQNGLPHLKL